MKVGTGYCNDENALRSGRKAAEEAIGNGGPEGADLVLAFCSGAVDHHAFLKGIQTVVGEKTPIVGGSAVGLITNDHLSYEGYPSGVALIGLDGAVVSVASVGGLDRGERIAGAKLAESLPVSDEDKLLLLFYDSVGMPPQPNVPPVLNTASALLDGITGKSGFDLPIVGAGLVGDHGLSRSEQFRGSFADRQCAVGALLGGEFSHYIRIMHGCSPLDGVYRTITSIDGSVIRELDGKPVVQVIDDLYGNREWRRSHPVRLLTLGVNHGPRYALPREGNYVNRLILGVAPGGDGIAIFEPDFKVGDEVQFMLRDTDRMIESAQKNSAELTAEIERDGKKADFGLYIDCAGRTGSYSNTTIEEASEVQRVFNEHKIPLLGFYSGVEIAPLLNKSRGLDWTGVLLIFARER